MPRGFKTSSLLVKTYRTKLNVTNGIFNVVVGQKVNGCGSMMPIGNRRMLGTDHASTMIRLSYQFVVEIFKKRSVIYELAKRRFQQQNRGSYLGFIWTFLQPLLFILVLYFVFTFGIKAPRDMEVMPFHLYLVCGMVCWVYFSGNLVDMTDVIREHAYLVKNVSFKLSILPFIPLMSSLVPHIFLVGVAYIMALLAGITPSIYLVQLVYYWFAMAVLLLGLGWLTSSSSIFIRDVRNIMAVVVQFGFWMTPIFWSVSLVPEKYRWIVKLNPVNYLVEGYRDSIVLGVPFWHKPLDTAYFWTFCVILLFIGTSVYRKLRPDFAEVL